MLLDRGGANYFLKFLKMLTRSKRVKLETRVVLLTRDALLLILAHLFSPIDVGRLRMVCKSFAKWIPSDRVQCLWRRYFLDNSPKCANCGHSPSDIRRHDTQSWMYYGDAPLNTLYEVRISLKGIYGHDFETKWDPPRRVNSTDLRACYLKLVKKQIIPCKCSELTFHIRASRTFLRCKHDVWCYACLCDKKDELVELARDQCSELSDDESGDELYPVKEEERDFW